MSTEQRSRWQYLRNQFAGFGSAMAPTAHGRTGWWRLPRKRLVFWTVVMLMTTGVGVYLRAEIHRRVSQVTFETQSKLVSHGGTLLIAGGGRLTDMVRRQFIETAGGRDARIVVIPAMAVEPFELAAYREPWDSYDVQSVDVLHTDSRQEADSSEFSQVLDTATAVWLAGGQQTWLTGVYGKTRTEMRLHALLKRNGVIGGTSAGAAVMSEVMIAGGRQTPTMGRGFGLISTAIIDQHFVKRNRFHRLQLALEQHPELVGFGIDEDTALLYAVATSRFRVLGQSCVVAVVPRFNPERLPQFQIEFFNPGDEFDVERLRAGDPVPPSSIDINSILMGE